MTSLDEPRSEKSDESDSDSDLDVLNVTVTRTIVNSEAEVKRGKYYRDEFELEFSSSSEPEL